MVNVLGDVRVVGPLAERGREEGDYVGGLKADSATLESGEKVSEGHLVVKGGLLLEGEEPGVFDDDDEELATRSTVLISLCSSILAVQRRSSLARMALFALVEMLSLYA